MEARFAMRNATERIVGAMLGLATALFLYFAASGMATLAGQDDWLSRAFGLAAAMLGLVLVMRTPRRAKVGRHDLRAQLRACRGASAQLPIFLLMGDNAERCARLASLVDAATPCRDEGSPGRLIHGAQSLWLDVDARQLEHAAWTSFANDLAGARRRVGVVLVLGAGALLDGDGDAVRREAAAFRACLDLLARALGERPPAYLVVDRVDRLYGMRSFANGVGTRRLRVPLGRMRRDDAEPAARFARSTLDACAREIADAVKGRRHGGPGSAAVLQAPAEFRRIRSALAAFCAEAFGENAWQHSPVLRGVFFGSAGVGGDAMPSLLADLPGFVPEIETTPRGGSWFLADALARVIPTDTPRRFPLPRVWRFNAVRARPGPAALVACSLALCALLTANFVDEALAIRTATRLPADSATLEDARMLLRQALTLGERGRPRFLPRLGLDVGDGLTALARQRFCDAYESAIVVPLRREMEAVVENAFAAAAPNEIGEAWRRLHQLRTAETAEHKELRAAFQAWRGADGDARLLGRLDDAGQALAARTDADTMAIWAESLDGARPVDTAAVWSPVPIPVSERERRLVGAAWADASYTRVKAVLAAAGDDQWRERLLGEYRRRAFAAWRRAAERVWLGCRENLADRDLPLLIRRLADGEDPATRFLALYRNNTAAMRSDSGENILEAGKGGDEARASFRRAVADAAAAIESASFPRLVAEHFTGDDRLASGPLARAGDAAASATAALPDGHPEGIDSPLSRLAVYDYARYLFARRAALFLDSRWRNEVYTPLAVAAATRGDDAARRRRLLEEFLFTAAAGFWRVDGDRIDNATRERLPFMFSREFLDYCAWALSRNGDIPATPGRPIRLRIKSLTAAPNARELPHSAEFALHGDGGGQQFVYRNFPVSADLDPEACRNGALTVRVVFPSGAAAWRIDGPQALGVFFRDIGRGAHILRAENAESGRDLLRRLDIDRLEIRAEAAIPERHAARAPAPALPRSIISPGGGHATDSMAAAIR